jgi:two-component system sensor histidine kinase YesM
MPLTVAAIITSGVFSRGIDRQTMETASSTAYSAANLCTAFIDVAVEASRRASYNDAITKAYQSYMKTGNYLSFYYEVDLFLTQNYRFNDYFKLSVLSFYPEADSSLTEKLNEIELYALNQSLFPSAGIGTARSAYQIFRREDLSYIMDEATRLKTYIGFMNRNGRVYMFRNLYLQGAEPTAVLVTLLNTTHWFDTLTNVPWSKNITIMINSSVIQVRGEELDIHALLEEHKKAGSVEGSVLRKRDFNILDPDSYTPVTYLAGELKRNDYAISYAVQADNSILMKEVGSYRYAIFAIMLLVIPFLFYVIRFFGKNISDPIKVLIDASEKIKNGAFGLRIAVDANSSEFNLLNGSFNDMSSQLRSQIEKIYLEELKLQDAKIKALQSQINPHFLGNTLEIINWEARLGNNAKVSRMLEALSVMLDAALGRSGDNLIHLSEEMMYVDSYLYIISERYGKRLKIIKEIDESLLEVLVPRLILQPVLENAIEHGVSVKQHGLIILRVYKSDGFIYLEIENDSVLSEFNKERIDSILSGSDVMEPGVRLGATRLGIRNTNERLKILFGDGGGLTVTGIDRGATLSRIAMPFAQSASRA